MCKRAFWTDLYISRTQSRRKICSIIDIKRDEFAFCTYKPVPGGVVRESEPEVLNENTLKQKLNEDNEKKLIVGDWNELNEKIIGDSSYLKFGSPDEKSRIYKS